MAVVAGLTCCVVWLIGNLVCCYRDQGRMNRATGKMNRGSCRRKPKSTTNRHVKREPGIYFANSDGEVEDMDQVRRRSFKEDGYRAENRVNVGDGKLEIEPPDDLGYEDYLKRNKDEQGMGIAWLMAEVSCYIKMKVITEKDAEAILETGRRFVMEERPNRRQLMLRNYLALQDALRTTAVNPGAKWTDYIDLDLLTQDLDEKREEDEEEELAVVSVSGN